MPPNYDFIARWAIYLATAPVLRIFRSALLGPFFIATMTLLNLFIAGLLAWFGYKLICMAIEAIKLAFRQADRLEKEFGSDIIGALKHQFLGQPGAPAGQPDGPKEDAP